MNMHACPPAQMPPPDNSCSPHVPRRRCKLRGSRTRRRFSRLSRRRGKEVYFDSEFGSLQSKINVRTLDNFTACAALTRRLPRLSHAFFYCTMPFCCLSLRALLTPSGLTRRDPAAPAQKEAVRHHAEQVPHARDRPRPRLRRPGRLESRRLHVLSSASALLWFGGAA